MNFLEILRKFPCFYPQEDVATYSFSTSNEAILTQFFAHAQTFDRHWNVNENLEVVLKIVKVEFEIWLVSVIWWSELKIYSEQGQIKELSLKNKKRV